VAVMLFIAKPIRLGCYPTALMTTTISAKLTITHNFLASLIHAFSPTGPPE